MLWFTFNIRFGAAPEEFVTFPMLAEDGPQALQIAQWARPDWREISYWQQQPADAPLIVLRRSEA